MVGLQRSRGVARGRRVLLDLLCLGCCRRRRECWAVALLVEGDEEVAGCCYSASARAERRRDRGSEAMGSTTLLEVEGEREGSLILQGKWQWEGLERLCVVG